LAKDHRENQDLVVAKGAVKPLVSLAKSTKTLCQVKAASALESLAMSNSEAQKEIDAADAQKPLIRLLKMWAIEVKEQGLCIFITQNMMVFCMYFFSIDFFETICSFFYGGSYLGLFCLNPFSICSGNSNLDSYFPFKILACDRPPRAWNF